MFSDPASGKPHRRRVKDAVRLLLEIESRKRMYGDFKARKYEALTALCQAVGVEVDYLPSLEKALLERKPWLANNEQKGLDDDVPFWGPHSGTHQRGSTVIDFSSSNPMVTNPIADEVQSADSSGAKAESDFIGHNPMIGREQKSKQDSSAPRRQRKQRHRIGKRARKDELAHVKNLDPNDREQLAKLRELATSIMNPVAPKGAKRRNEKRHGQADTDRLGIASTTAKSRSARVSQNVEYGAGTELAHADLEAVPFQGSNPMLQRTRPQQQQAADSSKAGYENQSGDSKARWAKRSDTRVASKDMELLL